MYLDTFSKVSFTSLLDGKLIANGAVCNGDGAKEQENISNNVSKLIVVFK